MHKMPESIGGFSQVEYLTVFVTIIFGVIVAEFFNGFGDMFRNRGKMKMNALHFLWTIFIFLTLIQNWYGIWPRTAFINHNFIYFLFSLIPLLIFHLMSVVLFPKIIVGKEVDMKKFYLLNARAFFGLFAVYLV